MPNDLSFTIHIAPWFWHGLAGFALGVGVGIVGGMAFIAHSMRGVHV